MAHLEPPQLLGNDSPLLDTPEACLAVILSHLDGAGKWKLFRVSHATRRLVLSHATLVRLTLAKDSKLHVVSTLLALYPDQLGFHKLKLCVQHSRELQLLGQVLHVGRVTELELQGSAYVVLSPEAVATCKGLHKLTLKGLTVSAGKTRTPFDTCTLLTHLALVNIHVAAPDSDPEKDQPNGKTQYEMWLCPTPSVYCAPASHPVLDAAVLPTLECLEIAGVESAMLNHYPALLHRITHLNTSHGDGWQRSLLHFAPDLYLGHLVGLSIGTLDAPLLSALCACPLLVHVMALRASFAFNASFLNVQLPPALRRLSFMGRLGVEDILCMPWLIVVPEVKITNLHLGVGAGGTMSAEEEEDQEEEVFLAASVLMKVPTLILGDPDSSKAHVRSLRLCQQFDAKAELLTALAPLAARLDSVLVDRVHMTPDFVSACGTTLGKHTSTLCMMGFYMPPEPEARVQIWTLLFNAMLHLIVMNWGYVGRYGASLEFACLRTACEACGRQIVLQVMEARVTEAEAVAASSPHKPRICMWSGCRRHVFIQQLKLIKLDLDLTVVGQA